MVYLVGFVGVGFRVFFPNKAGFGILSAKSFAAVFVETLMLH